MNITTFLNSIGLGDGEGSISSMRVMLYAVVLAVLIPAVWIAIATKTPLALSSDQLGLIGIAFGGKLIQNTQETTTPAAPKTP